MIVVVCEVLFQFVGVVCCIISCWVLLLRCAVCGACWYGLFVCVCLFVVSGVDLCLSCVVGVCCVVIVLC